MIKIGAVYQPRGLSTWPSCNLVPVEVEGNLVIYSHVDTPFRNNAMTVERFLKDYEEVRDGR
jgi:hypothetical protein